MTTTETEAEPRAAPGGPSPSEAQALIEEARRRQRRRRVWIAGLLAAALVVGVVVASAGGGPGVRSGGGHRGRTKVVARHTTPTTPTPPSVTLNKPDAVAMDTDGSVLIANNGTSQILRYVPTTRQLLVVAGTGVAGFSGDGGPAAEAKLFGPSALAVAPDGTIYIADSVNKRIRAIAPDGTISTVAGDGGTVTTGDGPAQQTAIASPQTLALAPDGTLYFSDGSSVWALSPSGSITTFLPFDDTPLPYGGFNPQLQLGTSGLAVDNRGDVYVADTDSAPETIDEFSPSGRFIMGWVNRTGCLSTAGDGAVLVCNTNGAVAKITGPGLTAGMSIAAQAGDGLTPVTDDRDFGLPGVVAASATAGASGEIYAVAGGGNGFSNRAGLISVDPDGQVHELVTGPPPPAH
jgi:hypothetical protein